jgi:hypothetical protein
MKNVFQKLAMELWDHFDWSGEMSPDQMMTAYVLFGVALLSALAIVVIYI